MSTKSTKIVKATKTNGITDVINITQDMGDKLTTEYNRNKDLKVAQLALKAYGTAIGGAKTQVLYKKLTGSPTVISFLEK